MTLNPAFGHLRFGGRASRVATVTGRAPGTESAAVIATATDTLEQDQKQRRQPLGIGIVGVMINVSETAATKISELLVEEKKAGGGLRVFVQGGGCSGFQYGMMIEENGQGAGDQVFESHGVKLFVDPISIQYLKNAEVDFVDTVTGGGFTIKNPNAKSTCGCGSSFSTE